MKTSPHYRSLTGIQLDLERRLSTMRMQVAMGREQAGVQLAKPSTFAMPDARTNLVSISVLCGRMDLGLSEVEICLDELKAAFRCRTILDGETVDRLASKVVSALAAAKELLRQLEAEGLEKWKNCAAGTEHAWLQCHAHFDLLRVHLSEAARVMNDAIEKYRRGVVARLDSSANASVRKSSWAAWLSRSIQMLLS